MFYSFWYAIRGIGFTIYSEKHMVAHLVLGSIAILMGIFFKISRIEWLCLLLTIVAVLIAEIVNTAIEITVDLYTRKKKLRAMLSKDIAAGAVLIAVINAIIVGYLLFFHRFVNLVID